jgi:hypothetical protein
MSILGLRAIVLAGALCCSSLPGVALAAKEVPSGVTREYDLKAAFLFNFARYVEWPKEAFLSETAPVMIGILGEDPFRRSLDDIVANESVGGRKLVVRRFASIEQLEPCQILFVSASHAKRLDQVLAKLGKKSVLTVGDSEGFTEHAGMIGFEMARNRLKLRINLPVARAAGLTISSQLLRQATIVGSEAGK